MEADKDKIETSRDSKARILSEESLRESQRFLSTLISNLPGYVYRCHAEEGEWYTQFASEGIYELTGYHAWAFLKGGQMSYGWLVHPDDLVLVQNEVKEALKNKRAYQITYRIRTADDKLKWVWEQGRGIYSDDGSLSATEGFITDITEKKLVEEEILQRNQELATLNRIGQSINKLADPSEILSLIYKMTGKLFDNNNLYIALYDEANKEISFPIYTIDGSNIPTGTRKPGKGLTEHVIKTAKPLIINNDIAGKFEKLGIEKRGQKSKSIMAAPMMLGKKVIGVITLQDYKNENAFEESQLELLMTIASQAVIALENSRLFMTLQRELEEKKRTEIQIKASLREKEILLQEIHHRVKNNLQIMSSLLRIQASYVKNKEVHKIFKESENRIRAMSLIHNKLYNSENYDRIDFTDYIKTLISGLFISYGVSSERILLNINLNNTLLNIDTMIPCGLIINELVSNSLKYAFPNNRNGSIMIKLSHDENELSLIVKDDGIGFKHKVDINSTDTLGIKLVKLLASQMDGKVEINSKVGTETKIIFKEIQYKERT
jgi:PAS domain S-box-containing protein